MPEICFKRLRERGEGILGSRRNVTLLLSIPTPNCRSLKYLSTLHSSIHVQGSCPSSPAWCAGFPFSPHSLPAPSPHPLCLCSLAHFLGLPSVSLSPSASWLLGHFLRPMPSSPHFLPILQAENSLRTRPICLARGWIWNCDWHIIGSQWLVVGWMDRWMKECA